MKSEAPVDNILQNIRKLLNIYHEPIKKKKKMVFQKTFSYFL